MSRDLQDDQQQAPHSPEAVDRPKRAWRTPEIVEVGDALDLTEAVGGNLNDSPNVGMDVTYKN